MVRIRCIQMFLVAACLLGGAFAVSAQRGGAAVPVGTMLPDLTVYDAEGQAFSLTELRGSYSVLVFGCLT